jgi:acetoin utilization deacetylase AcuC-like enzyme
MLPFKLIYDPRYDLNLGAHVFPSQKYRLVHDALLEQSIAAADDFLTPEPATDDEVLLVHGNEYVHKLKTGTLSNTEKMRLEIPWSREMVEACWLAAGGSILAGRRALADGCAANIGGGFHHAYPDHGEGFCAIHDVAVAIRSLQRDRAIETGMVIDTDVHHGNGTAAIFGGDPTVFTFSIHQENNYPYPKPPSNIDVDLPDGIEDQEYLELLAANVQRAFREFKPGIVFYIAGADPYREDQLGGLALSLDGLARRDAMVLDYARGHRVPVVITLAGGYARRVADTVRIHVGTIAAARDAANRAAQNTAG